MWDVELAIRTSSGTSQSPEDDVSFDGHRGLQTARGETTLGWLIPNTPPGCTNYAPGVEVVGTVRGVTAQEAATLSKVMYQDRYGTTRVRLNGVWGYIQNEPTWVPDGSSVSAPDYFDLDHVHSGSYNSKLFLRDAPGFDAYATNDNLISSGLTDLQRDRHYKDYVKTGSIVVSNELTWDVAYSLDVVNAHWHVVSHNP